MTMAERSVPYFEYPALFKQNSDEFIETLKMIGNRGAYIMQSDLRDFEKSLEEYTGAKHAVGVANATDGLQMLMMATGLEQGSEVLFCSHTMVATASAIHFAGGVPVPVESGRDSILDPKTLEKAITAKTKAVCVTQLNGRCGNMDDILAVCKKHNLKLYEDSAQALGSRYKNQHAGTFGEGGCISFYPAKILGCLGDGGAVLCQDTEVYEKLLLLRDHGRDHQTGEVKVWGFNSRLDNLHAAWLNQQFQNYEHVVSRRREIASKYNDAFKNIDALILPPPPSDGDHFDVFQNYEIQAERRDNLKTFLKDNGIGTLVQWGGKAVHQFEGLGFKQSLPKTEEMFEKLLMLPINMFISDEDVQYICEKVKAFYSKM